MSSEFGDELKRRMRKQDIGVNDLARRTGYSRGHISNLRNGVKQPSPEAAEDLDTALKAGGALTALAAGPARSEPAAPRLQYEWAGAGVPLLPSDDISPVEHLLNLRLVLAQQDNLFGPASAIPAVTAQLELIKKLRAETSGADSRALLGVQARYAESLGWLYQDRTDHRTAQHWLDRSLEWALGADDLPWAAYTLARKSQHAGDMHDPDAAVDLAAAAARFAGDGRLRAAGAAYQALGHALNRDKPSAMKALDIAEEAIAEPSDADPGDPWTPWLTLKYVAERRAHCAAVLGDYEAALPLFGQAIEGTDSLFRRDRGVFLSRAAVAYAGAGDPGQAAASGMRALGILRITGSGRIALELRRLDVQLRQWKTHPEAAEFRASLTAAQAPRP